MSRDDFWFCLHTPTCSHAFDVLLFKGFIGLFLLFVKQRQRKFVLYCIKAINKTNGFNFIWKCTVLCNCKCCCFFLTDGKISMCLMHPAVCPSSTFNVSSTAIISLRF